MISVILCVYNGEEYLHRAVESYLKQTYSDTELIIVDDGSVDKTADMCDGYASQYETIRVFHTENKGLGSARKTGFAQVRGDWVVFYDVDDWFDEDWLEQLHRATCETEGVEIIIGNAKMCYEDNGEITYQKRQSMSEEYVFESRNELDFLTANAIAARINDGANLKVKALRSIGTVWDKLYNVSFLRKNGIDFREVRLSEDLRFTSECFSKCNRAKYVSATGYNYFIHEGSLSKGKDIEYVRANQATVEHYLNHLNMSADIIQQAVAVAQLRFFAMDVKQYFLPAKNAGRNVTEEVLELIKSDVFVTAIKPLNLELNNLPEEEKNLYLAIQKGDMEQMI